ncbi:hypothetical protein PGT21_006704 [Puccinia graminis f. sp. tritici]|uniref:Uncharacterized protein n=1 Tax=Puccinia graminis f. sp. tritici TaxID=56615 RepID=A0A5B0M985_PUCGR|nr:hypothetical protein PGT21_006704 [Puccinia graminis f. sp. tritici]
MLIIPCRPFCERRRLTRSPESRWWEWLCMYTVPLPVKRDRFPSDCLFASPNGVNRASYCLLMLLLENALRVESLLMFDLVKIRSRIAYLLKVTQKQITNQHLENRTASKESPASNLA